MTRKDYILIAQAFKNGVIHNNIERGVEREFDNERDAMLMRTAEGNIAVSIANALAADNPRFDRERFLAACGVAK